MPRFVITAVMFLALAGSASAAPSDARLTGVGSFAFGLGTGTLEGDVPARFRGFDLVVVDGEEATRAQIAALRAQGSVVLGYLSVGTIERGRSWYRSVKHYRLDLWDDFGEWYADTSKRGYREVIARKVAPKLLRKGFDGLFLDNVDMIETHRPQTRGMRSLVKTLARGDHLLFAQNGDDVIAPFVPHLDGWNREDVTWTYEFDSRRYERVPAEATADAQATLRRLAARGLLVTTADYVSAGDSSAEQESVANSCAAGAVPYVADIGLTRVPTQPFTCPQPGLRWWVP